jgi:hypothetical protein
MWNGTRPTRPQAGLVRAAVFIEEEGLHLVHVARHIERPDEAAMFKQGLSVGVMERDASMPKHHYYHDAILYSSPAPKTALGGKKSKGLVARRSGVLLEAAKATPTSSLSTGFRHREGCKAGHLVAGRPTASNA